MLSGMKNGSAADHKTSPKGGITPKLPPSDGIPLHGAEKTYLELHITKTDISVLP